MPELGSLFAFNLALFAQAFVLLFSVFNAIGTAPVFLALSDAFPKDRPKIVRQSVLIATLVLLIFAYLGLFIFQVLGITLNDFRIAGGIVLFLVALDYLRGRVSETKSVGPGELAAFPLAMPLLAGPGSISTVILFVNPPFSPLMALLAIVLNALLAWVILGRGMAIQKLLGTNGSRIFTRIMGLLIAAIGISFVREGIIAAAKAAMG